MATSYFSQQEGQGLIICLSTDTKPTVANGMLLIETNTGKFFLRQSDAWVEKLNNSYVTLLEATAWGSITGALALQLDLQAALDAKAVANHNHDATYEAKNTNIQAHVVSAHAPSNAQKNSDITKAEIEAKLTGELASHTHAALAQELYNQSVANQSGFAVDTYLTGSNIAIARVKAGTRYRCLFNVVKTAAGIATPIINVRIGTAAAVADTSRGTLTFSAQTGVIDEGVFEVLVTFRTVGAGSAAVAQSLARLSHRLSITGLGVGVSEPEIATSTGFDSTVSSLQIGLSVNGGASAAWTASLVQAELLNLN